MGRRVVEVCVNGHEIAKVGRYRSDRDKYGPCKACNRDAAARARKRRTELLAKIKLERGCEVCGYRRCAWSLDFHHRDPGEKSFSVGAVNRGRTLAVVLAEVEKCDVICRNCHGELHEKERLS
jgi:hypothetical protein